MIRVKMITKFRGLRAGLLFSGEMMLKVAILADGC